MTSKSVLQCVAVIALVFPAPSQAQAQGFLQSLFGGGQARQSRHHMRPPPHGYHSGRFTRHGQSVPWWGNPRQSRRQQSRYYIAMCVRMCDGYYYPMSNRVTRGKFYEFAQRCKSSCDGNAKLFYMPSQGGDVARMTDLTGRAYEHIDTAFLYRKKLVKACTCKPMPWSYRARARHMEYAVKDAEAKLRRAQKAQRLASLQALQDDDTSGRTIVESLDDTVSTPAQDADDAVAAGMTADFADEAKKVRRPKTYRIRKNRRHRRLRRVRRRPNVSRYNGYYGGRPKHVWHGQRRRRR